MQLRYLLFDLDNTLYPKESQLLATIDRRIDEYLTSKISLPPAEISELRKRYLLDYGTTIGGMVAKHQIDPAEYLGYAYDLDVARYLKPDPLLATDLASISLTKIIFSNSPREYVERVLEVLGIRQCFAAIYDIEFCKFLGKPNPSSYHRVLADLGADGRECILVDDVLANVLGAKEVGITPVYLSPGPCPKLTWVINQVNEITSVLPEIIATRLSA